MKQITQFSLLLFGLMIVVAGCDKAKEAASEATEKASEMANIDFGDFDMKGLEEKMSGITDGFKSVSADSVDGLTSKITELTGSFGDLGIDKLPEPAKKAVVAAVQKFGGAIKTAMDAISDDSILAKLKPVVEALMEKVSAME